MKKTNKEWLDILYGWASKAEALRLAGVLSTYNYNIYGSGSYLSMEFTIGDIKFKLDNGEDGDETTFNAVNTKLEELRENAIGALSNQRAEIDSAIQLLVK